MLEVRLLGKFDVKSDGRLVAIPSRPAQSLFAYLILSAGTSHRREKLAGLLWPDSTEEGARDYLRHALWKIRKAIEPASSKGRSDSYISADDIHVSFNPESTYSLDVAKIRNIGENTSTKELMKVLSLYEGELLPGYYEDWVLLEREHLQAVYEQKMARLLSLYQDEGRWLDILDWGERWIKLGQKPEPAFRALMSAHAAKGNMSKVAATYERCVKSLNEFGIEPSEQTKQLYEILKSGKESPRAESASLKTGVKEVSPKIPVPLTSFIGREKELKDITRLLSSSRLLTLTGSGGVGKTRLAIQTATSSVRKFKGEVYWVGLVGLSNGNLIPQEIAQSLNLREASEDSLIEVLKRQLIAKDVLLVLDNCEHLIQDCAYYAEELLAGCPKLKILATSIEALGIFHEVIWQVPSLPLPEAAGPLSLKELQGFESIKLFEERASVAKAGFALDEGSAASAVQICQRLDGIPLAIELAAARIKMLSVEEIAARLDDRFSLLTSGSRTAIPRHQTLRATIDWSYDLLTESEQILLRRLSVFTGGFTLEAAEAVCSQGMDRSDILDLLGRLVDKSLVIVEEVSKTRETRYRLLETIRQYALEKFTGTEEARAIRDRHLEFYLELTEKSEPYIFSSKSIEWVNRLGKELDNIRAAMDWSTNSGKATSALQMAGSLVYFWWAHALLPSEWYERVQQALSRPEGRERTLARAKALNGIGFIFWLDVDLTDRRPELEEALSIGRELEDRWNIEMALRNLGLLELIRNNFPEARRFLEQSLEIWREMNAGDNLEYARTLSFLGDVALSCNEMQKSRSLYDEAVVVLKGPEVGDINFLGYPTRRLGEVAWREGRYTEASAYCKESLRLNHEVSDRRGVICSVSGFAAIAVAQGEFERALKLMAAVDTQLTSIGIRLLYMDKKEYERNLALVRAKLDEKTLVKSWEKGKKMSFEEVIAFALEGT